MTDTANSLIVCIPSKDFPTFPDVAYKQHGNRYTESTCDECGHGIWLGVNSAKLLSTGIPKVCPYCARDKYGVDFSSEPIIPLTKSNPGGK